MRKEYLQTGIVCVTLAVVMHLGLSLAPRALPILLFLGTGRWAGQSGQTAVSVDLPEESSGPESGDKAVFAAGDQSLVEVHNVCGYGVDVGAMLATPLTWNLRQAEPTVLILHSHGTESYRNTENYVQTTQYRTLDKGYNVVSVGDYLAQKLEAAGIRVIHDTTLHDYPSYNDSYVEARDAIAAYLAEYPSICLVLDIHRDAVEDEAGNQVGQAITVDGQKTAQLMMVVGTDASGRNHPDWEKNMALAVKLHVQLQKQTPGICRAISFRTQRFNQDLSPGGLLIEVGAAGNTRQEALLAAEKLAEGIIALAEGTEVY